MGCIKFIVYGILFLIITSFISTHKVLASILFFLAVGLVITFKWFMPRWNQGSVEILEGPQNQVSAQTLGELLMLTPSEFEVAVAQLLQKLGYSNVQVVGGAGDLGVDIVCWDDQSQKIVVQCKRYAPGRRVGSPDLQSFLGMMTIHHQAHSGIFVTTSTFSQPALDLAGQHPVTLIDGNQLTQLLHKDPGIEKFIPE